jgi:hypothetical protein
MANWMTARQISKRFAVGEERLLDYSRRGNLPMRREPDGVTLFDESVVARFFRPRSGAMLQPNGKNLGVLGESRLGIEPAMTTPAAPGGREARRLALQASRAKSPSVREALKKAG